MDFEEAVEKFVIQGRKLNPVQEAALKTGFLEGKNLIVSSPTSSGKTMIAEMAIIRSFMNGEKSIYLSPLKSLADEKYREFSKFEELGMKVAISTGDFDSSDQWLTRYDLVITTSEKLDSLIRHGSAFIPEIGLVVADEIHMLNDLSRGPTLELNLMRLMNRWIVGLSATIRNAEEIAEWLDAELVVSDYRPVRLDVGILHDGVVEFADRKIRVGNEEGLVRQTIEAGKQILIFVASRRSAEAYAEKLGRALDMEFGKAEDILVIDPPTPQCERLKHSLEKGVAFHHAGLHPGQKRLIEKWFRNGELKVIVATPTLAMGVNLPAFRVLVRDLKRFSGGYSDFIPAMEINQMLGRAGRLGFDDRGEAIINAKTEAELEWARRIDEIEDVYSKMSVGPVLRSHLLAMIAEGMNTEEDLLKFLSRSFFAFQYGSSNELRKAVSRAIGNLWDWGMVELDEFRGRIEATPAGKRVAQLYIDPFSGFVLGKAIDGSLEDKLFAISMSTEMRPLLRPKKGEDWYMEINDELVSLSFQPEACMKTASFLMEWMDERTEKELYMKYGISPGGIVSKTRTAEWLAYSMEELAKLKKKYRKASEIEKLRKRLASGAREELLPLIAVKGIGRARARKLFNAGITNPVKMRKAGIEKLAGILGRKTAEKVLKNLSI